MKSTISPKTFMKLRRSLHTLMTSNETMQILMNFNEIGTDYCWFGTQTMSGSLNQKKIIL